MDLGRMSVRIPTRYFVTLTLFYSFLVHFNMAHTVPSPSPLVPPTRVRVCAALGSTDYSVTFDKRTVN